MWSSGTQSYIYNIHIQQREDRDNVVQWYPINSPPRITNLFFSWYTTIQQTHRRRIKTEQQAKGVTSVQGKNLFNYLPRQLFFLQDDFEEQDIFFLFFQIILVQFILLFKIVLGKTASANRNSLNSSPQTAATTFAFFFYLYRSSMNKPHVGWGGQQTIFVPSGMNRTNDIFTNVFKHYLNFFSQMGNFNCFRSLMDLCYFSKYLLFANICLTSISVNIDLIYLKIDLLNLFLLFRKVYLP